MVVGGVKRKASRRQVWFDGGEVRKKGTVRTCVGKGIGKVGYPSGGKRGGTVSEAELVRSRATIKHVRDTSTSQD